MEQGFFRSLFDLSFTSLITTRVIKVLYVLSLILIGLTALLFVVLAFARSAAAGVVTLLVIAPLASFFYVIYTRVILELFIAIFRIVENTGQLLAVSRTQTGLPPTGGHGQPWAPTPPGPPPQPLQPQSAPPPPPPPSPPPPPPAPPPSQPLPPQSGATKVRPTIPRGQPPGAPPPGELPPNPGSGPAPPPTGGTPPERR